MSILSIIRNKTYSSLKDMSDILKNIGAIFSFKTRQQYISRLDTYYKCISFPWRKDQKDVLKNFVKFSHKNYVIHAVFGSGKTTLLLGMLIYGLLTGSFKPDKVMFMSFNISIRNEIKRKLKDYGLSGKISIRTFDSVIYEIAKIAEYPYIDLPNFDGKRRFVYEKTFDESFQYLPVYQPSVIFIDECQDLEKNTLKILNKFYPNTKFVFSGDIFQSIQKEPRESILWHFMTNEIDDTYKIYMRETPRVPMPVLNSIQKALKAYYPEFKDKIDSWTSTNEISNVDIKWKQFKSYNHMFEKIQKFTQKYQPEEGMILTFSSAITVRGAMGDVARIRRFMVDNNIPVNTNHKKLNPDTFFLSTANSSKGLERDYVIIFLTFPLERAFINLSDDIVVNLITVALSRAKKKVIMYVPMYEDKFSRVLNIFEKCPLPEKKRIHDGKTVKEFGYSDYMNLEHCVTELIRMSIVKYDTRIDLKNYTKPYEFSKVFPEDIAYKLLPIITDEERSFVGVLIENLITSTWTSKWPDYIEFDGIDKNPMFNHVKQSVKRSLDNYRKFIRKTIFDDSTQFQGIYLYSQIHTAVSNKIFINLKPELMQNLKGYWKKLKPKCNYLRPEGGMIKIQANLQMPWVTGIADAVVVRSNGKEDKEVEEIELIEIKASQEFEWKDNALLQVLIYSLMTGKSWARLHLINPFRNEKVSYYFDSKKIMTLRHKVISDTLIYNTNSFMAKMYGNYKLNEPMDVTDTMFVDITRDENKKIKQISVLNMVSPIKCELVYNDYSNNSVDKNKNMEKTEKLRSESEKDNQMMLEDLDRILNSDMNKNKKKFGLVSYKKLGIQGLDITTEELIESVGYVKDEDKKYSLDIDNSLHRNLLCLSRYFTKNRFV
jgi:hypothetical protein